MQFRIGDRDPVTGLYYVIWPDDSTTLNGIKNFNSASKPGDLVQATRRSDGLIVLDGPKAVDEPVGLFGAIPGSKPDGYLRGQIWNDDEDKKNEGDLSISLETLETSIRGFTTPLTIRRKKPVRMKRPFDTIWAIISLNCPKSKINFTSVIDTSTNAIAVRFSPNESLISISIYALDTTGIESVEIRIEGLFNDDFQNGSRFPPLEKYQILVGSLKLAVE